MQHVMMFWNHFFFVAPTWALSWRGLYANSDTLRLYLTPRRCKAAFNRQEIEEQKRLQEEQLDKTNRISLYHAIHAMDICGIRLNWLNKATVFVLRNLFLHLLLCSPATGNFFMWESILPGPSRKHRFWNYKQSILLPLSFGRHFEHFNVYSDILRKLS
jgi:hypothetical protein